MLLIFKSFNKRPDKYESTFETDSLSYESFSSVLNAQTTHDNLAKIFYSDVITKVNSISSISESSNFFLTLDRLSRLKVKKSNLYLTGIFLIWDAQIQRKYADVSKTNNYLVKRFSSIFDSQKSVKMNKLGGSVTKTKTRSNVRSLKTVTSYEFLKKTLPTLRQSDIYEPVRALESLYSQIYSVVKLPTYVK